VLRDWLRKKNNLFVNLSGVQSSEFRVEVHSEALLAQKPNCLGAPVCKLTHQNKITLNGEPGTLNDYFRLVRDRYDIYAI